MRSEKIIDSRLSINLNLDHTLRANSFFLTNPANRAHLANQLLLYDKVVIPTKDFGIVPILIYWFGPKDFERVLKSGAIYFLDRPSLLGYAGNGVGISGFIIQPSESRSFEWWQEALFGDMAKAIDIQLQYMCPFINRKQRSKLLMTIVEHSRPLQYDNDSFMKHIVHESYTDITLNPELSALVASLSRNPERIDLTRIPGVEPNQLKVLATDHITTPVDLILRVADINMTLVMGAQSDKSDVFVPQGSESILKGKLTRAKVTPTALDNFVSLLDLEDIPDPGVAVYAGELSLAEIWRIRQSCKSRKFRKWLRVADTGNARDLEKMYVSSLGKKSFYEKLPTKIIRFAITKAADVLLPLSGTILDVADSFFVERWLRGYSPRLFLDQLRKIQGLKVPRAR